jgi:hypothetical protein
VFSPATDRVVDQLAVFTIGTGRLQIDLVANDTLEASWTVEVSGDDWSHYLVDVAPLELRSGVSYSLEFSAASGTMTMSSFRDGSLGTGKIFARGGSWSDGYVQADTGDGWNDVFFTYADLTGVSFVLT